MKRQKVIVWGMVAVMLGFFLPNLGNIPPTAEARRARCNRKLCFRWDKRRRRCVFRCKVGREVCYNGKCIRMKRCSSLRCLRFDPSRRRCVSRCPRGWLCDRGRCRRRCAARHCYNKKKSRCVRRCPRGKRCRKGICR